MLHTAIEGCFEIANKKGVDFSNTCSSSFGSSSSIGPRSVGSLGSAFFLGGGTLGAHVNGLDGSDAEEGLDESDAEREITGRLYLLDGSHAEG